MSGERVGAYVDELRAALRAQWALDESFVDKVAGHLEDAALRAGRPLGTLARVLMSVGAILIGANGLSFFWIVAWYGTANMHFEGYVFIKAALLLSQSVLTLIHVAGVRPGTAART